jgi:type VI secretion system secreted protein Hcp
MAFDVFVQIDGIPGESLDDQHPDWIEVLSFEHAMEQPASASASSSGGATAERVNHKPFIFVHQIDKASPKLAEACCKGTHIAKIVFEFCRAGGEEKTKYYEVVLEQALVNSIKPRGATDKDERGFPTEEVALTYGKINWNYIQQKRSDGAGGGSVATGWDLTSNKGC